MRHVDRVNELSCTPRIKTFCKFRNAFNNNLKQKIMKNFYLRDKYHNCKIFSYDNLSDLKYEFESRNITIGSGAIIGDYATIGSGANIGEGAIIGVGTRIGEGAIIGYYVTIGIGARIGNHAIIGSRAIIGNYVGVGHRDIIGIGATIGEQADLTKSIYVSGSKHSLTYDGVDKICIGCERHSVDYWNENFKKIGEKNKYSKEQIEEYSNHIQVITLFHNLNRKS